jgi:phosphatidylglycerophosphatase A
VTPPPDETDIPPETLPAIAAASPLSAVDRICMVLATGFGIGLIPGSPGTYGSLWGLAIAAGLDRLAWSPVAHLATLAALLLLGVPICQRGAAVMGLKDPGPVVYDEFLSLPLAFVAVPFRWETALAGFALFRLFDITKPGPVRRLEQLPGGWGIMADDLGAGLLAALVLWAAVATGLL